MFAKTNCNFMKNIFNTSFYFLALGSLIIFSQCNDTDEPAIENEQEIVTDVILTFTDTDGNVVTAKAIDPDGEGFASIEVVDDILLKSNTSYVLSIELENGVTDESLTSEIMGEADEHLFFFSFTENIFSDPIGDGNIDNRQDALNYLDKDEADLPLGLSTSWTTAAANTGKFRVVLKHQPDIKSAVSAAVDGESDIDLEWNIQIED